MDKLPISLIIIAHNEEHNLVRCLDSAASLAGEIIGVINDCTDRTREVLESYGAKVYERKWEGMTVQKNRALNYASMPWILNLDADEELTPALVKEIKKFVNTPGKYVAGSFPRKIWFWGRWIKHGDWYPDRAIRIFRRDGASFEGGTGHEKVRVNGKIKKLSNHLNHFSFRSINDIVTKYPRFGDAHLKYQIDCGKEFSWAKTIFRAKWRFFRCYFIKQGFRDGYAGFFIACNQFYYTLFRYSRLYENQQAQKTPYPEKEDL